MTKHYCKKCFKTIVDRTASDKFLLTSGDDMICECCGKKGSVVAEYFKYGEPQVTPDGKRMKCAAKHIGVDPNYSIWANKPTYPI